jgi:hypothetical protein
VLSNHASSLAKLVSSRGTSSPIASLISAVSCAQPYGIFIAPDIIALDTDSPKLTSLFSSAFSKIVLSFVASAKPFDPLGYKSIASSVALFYFFFLSSFFNSFKSIARAYRHVKNIKTTNRFKI